MKANEEHTHVLNAVNSDNFEKIYLAKLNKYFTYLDEMNANAANQLNKTLLPSDDDEPEVPLEPPKPIKVPDSPIVITNLV